MVSIILEYLFTLYYLSFTKNRLIYLMTKLSSQKKFLYVIETFFCPNLWAWY